MSSRAMPEPKNLASIIHNRHQSMDGGLAAQFRPAWGECDYTISPDPSNPQSNNLDDEYFKVVRLRNTKTSTPSTVCGGTQFDSDVQRYTFVASACPHGLDKVETSLHNIGGLSEADSCTAISMTNVQETQPQNDSGGSANLYSLLTSELEHCQPAQCGPDVACLEFNALLPIEECLPEFCIEDFTQEPSGTGNNLAYGELFDDQNHQMFFELPSPPASRLSSPETNTFVEDKGNSGYQPITPQEISITAFQGQTQNLRPIEAKARPFTTPCTFTFDSNNPTSTTTKTAIPINPSQPKRQASNTSPLQPKNKRNSKLRARQAHSQTERKYREKMNQKLTQLHTLLIESKFGPPLLSSLLQPASKEPDSEFRILTQSKVSSSSYYSSSSSSCCSHHHSSSSSFQSELIGHETGMNKTSKADILAAAMAYILHNETVMSRCSG